MKRWSLLIILGNLFIACVAPNVVAEPEEKLYGKINLSMVNSDVNGASEWQLNSNASRVGFIGKRPLSDTLFVHYAAEFEVYPDDGNKTSKSTVCPANAVSDESCLVTSDRSTFSQRNITLAISGDLGRLWAGKRDTPSKVAQNKIDLFNDLEGDIKNTFEGENRVSNIIGVSTSKFFGLNATIAMVPGEGSDTDSDGIDDTGLSDGIGYSVSYTGDNLYVAIAGDEDIDNQDLLRLVARYRLNALTIGAMHQKNQTNDNSVDESGYFLSAAYTAGKTVFKAQFGRVTGEGTNEEETLSFGADYKVAKDTKMYIFFTENRDFDGQSDDQKAMGIGLEQKF